MLTMIGWKAGSTKVMVDDNTSEQDMLDLMDPSDQAAWKNFSKTSSTVMIVSTASDSGDDPGIDTIEHCE